MRSPIGTLQSRAVAEGNVLSTKVREIMSEGIACAYDDDAVEGSGEDHE